VFKVRHDADSFYSEGRSQRGHGDHRRRFFESITAKVNPQRATHIWNAGMLGDPYARDMIEELCGIEIVDSDTGFGFLQ
jgi:hypothetical protein